MNRAEGMGYSQLPDQIIQPRDGKGKDCFVETRRNSFILSVKGVFGLVFLCVSLEVF